MIRLTFEGEFYLDVIAAIRDFLSESDHPDTVTPIPLPKATATQTSPELEAGLKAVIGKTGGQLPKPKPKSKSKLAAKPPKAATPKPVPVTAPPEPVPEPMPEPAFEDIVLEQPEPEPEPEPEVLDPVQLTAIRVRTTEDLQAAYSSGRHKQVLALLAKYGNGAKSFRELQIKDFIPIRKAIDEGALA